MCCVSEPKLVRAFDGQLPRTAKENGLYADEFPGYRVLWRITNPISDLRVGITVSNACYNTGNLLVLDINQKYETFQKLAIAEWV